MKPRKTRPIVFVHVVLWPLICRSVSLSALDRFSVVPSQFEGVTRPKIRQLETRQNCKESVANRIKNFAVLTSSPILPKALEHNSVVFPAR